MKTLMALLVSTDCRPTMTHHEFAKLRNKHHRTIQNEISAGECPVPMWKDGANWICNVADVAAWLDRERDAAIRASQSLQQHYDLDAA